MLNFCRGLFTKKGKELPCNIKRFVLQSHRLGKQSYGYQRGKVRRRDKLGVWE